MQPVSSTYKNLVKKDYTVEWKASIGGIEYTSDKLVSARTQREVLSGDNMVGNCVSAQLDISLLVPPTDPPRMAEILLYARIRYNNSVSEWIPKGTYYISTRKEEMEGDGIDVLDIHAYDAMLKAEQAAAQDGEQGSWPKTDLNALSYIANRIGVQLDSRINEIVVNNYSIPYPGYGDDGYSLREILSYIASAYACNALITDENKLRLVPIYSTEEETNLLVDENGNRIVFGDNRIIVGG